MGHAKAELQRKLRGFATRRKGILTIDDVREMIQDPDFEMTNLLVRFDKGTYLAWAMEIERVIRDKQAAGWVFREIAFTDETYAWATCGMPENPHAAQAQTPSGSPLRSPCAKCKVLVDWDALDTRPKAG